MKRYYFKATKDNMVSGYDPVYIHKMGHNEHPNPNRKSKDPCGRGVHLARTINDALNYVEDATEVYLATSIDIIGGDDTKVRVGEYDILWKIPQGIIKEYQSKWDALYKEYQPKWDALDKEYQPKRDALDKEYQSKWDALYKEYQPKWDALYKEYQPKWDALDRKILRKILRLYTKESI